MARLTLTPTAVVHLLALLSATLGLALSPAEDIGNIDSYVRAQMEAAQVPGLALGVVQGDRVLHLRGFGAADDSGRAVSPQTPFNLGSVTKSFTAMAVMQLVEKGQIQLDAPVQQYLPWFRLAGGAASSVVTVRELLNQTSGIGTGQGEDVSLCRPRTTPEDMVRSLAKVWPRALPGRSFQYADANYITLGVLVEAVSGQPYADYVQQHILAPLDMTNTFLSGEQALQHGVAVGHGTVAGRSEASPPGYFCPGYLGASFIVSTAQDMTHWLIAHLNQGRYGSRSVLSPAGIAELHRPAVPAESLFGPGSGYGMGWFAGNGLGAPVIWHGGDDSYFHSDVLMAPKQHLGVVALMNASVLRSPYAIPRASIPALVLASLVEANMPFGLGVPALLVLIVMAQAALTLRLVVVLRRGRLGPGPATVGGAARHMVAPLLINMAWAVLVLAPLLWLMTNLYSGLPLLLLLPWHVSLLLVSGAFAAAWALARTGLVVVVRARRRNMERTC